MKKLFLLLACLMAFPVQGFAMEIRAGENVMLNERINDDTYLAGEAVRLHGEVNGDVFLVGGKVAVDGKVSQDLNLLGGDVTVQGEVGDDLRMAGGSVLVNGTVKDDLIMGGGDLELGKNSFVGGDLVFGGGEVSLNGKVNGNIVGGVGRLYLNGEVTGNVLLNSGEVTVGPNAKIGGNLKYRSTEKSEALEAVTTGAVEHKMIERHPAQENPRMAWLGFLAGFSLYRFLSTLLFGLFILWIYRTATVHVNRLTYESPLSSLGVGFLSLILPPVAMLLFIVTLIGVPVAIVLFFGWIVFLLLGKIFASALIGGKILKTDEKSGFWKLYGSFALGALIFSFIGLIPVVGFFFKLIFCLLALGGMLLYYVETFSLLRKKKLL